MEKLLLESPWLLIFILGAGVAVACTAIVFVTDYLRRSKQAEIDAALKHEMLGLGMSAADIKTVLEASTEGGVIQNYNCNQPVRVGLGKFQVEVGALQRGTPAEAPAS